MIFKKKVVIKEGKTRKSFEDTELTIDNIVDEVSKATDIPKDIVRRIILFVNFSIFTKDGELTKFAKEYGIKNYKDYYKILEKIKENYKNDREVIAFSDMYNTLAKSVYLRASAWIFTTFVRFQDEEQEQKYFTTGLYSVSFTNRTFGNVMENLKTLQKVLNKFDDYQDIVSTWVEEQKYTNEKGNK